MIIVLNNRISMLQESGIYQYEARKSINPKGFGPEVDERILEEFRLEPIVFREIKGIFAFFVIGLGFASVVIIIEIIVFIIRTKTIWIYYSDEEREESATTSSSFRDEVVQVYYRLKELIRTWVKAVGNIWGKLRRILLRFIRRNTISIQN